MGGIDWCSATLNKEKVEKSHFPIHAECRILITGLQYCTVQYSILLHSYHFLPSPFFSNPPLLISKYLLARDCTPSHILKSRAHAFFPPTSGKKAVGRLRTNRGWSPSISVRVARLQCFADFQILHCISNWDSSSHQ